jgi:bifunctional non-homologous end joining protein LigD
VIWREKPGSVRPMLATLAEPPLSGAQLIYEPKYDGIRALVEIEPARGRATVRLWSRLGNEKTAQFPAIVHALEAFAASLRQPLVVDAEIVALDRNGQPTGFQRLQGRIHLSDTKDVARLDRDQPVALIAFDLLRDANEDIRGLPLVERRKRLEQRFQSHLSGTLRLSEQAIGDGHAMYARAKKEGWEGLIVKDAQSPYQSGRRSPTWRKLKVVQQQEFVVGGWTEPRQTRQYFGALLLGEYADGALRYVGHTGTGFDQKELARLSKLLKARAAKTSPFAEPIKSNEPAHWVRPDLVAQIRFTERTADGRLRHPVYLGLRDDKSAKDVEAPLEFRLKAKATPSTDFDSIIDQLNALEAAKKDGLVELPGGERVKVTNLAKPFWKDLGITKGELFRYYVQASPFILPCVADRPMVMKRFPNGVGGQAFYQHKVAERGQTQFVGGSLKALLEMTQLAAISQDPWFSRVQSPHEPDYVALDLDPSDAATFATVLDVARWVRDELKRLKIPGFPKTSGASGLHVYIPLPPHTSYESGMLFCQIVATLVATRHPKQATVERTVSRRPKGTVYVDYLQNIEGKTLATAYSARANAFAGVSTPLTWKEIDGRVDPRDFTIRTALDRFRSVGDLWAGLRTSPPADLEAVLRKG